MTSTQIVICLGVFIIVVVAIALHPHDDCPRMILGYKCRGKDCDHSIEEVAKALRSMER